MQMLLIFFSIQLIPVLDRAGGHRGIKRRTDEFRQAVSRPELRVGWGCLFAAPDTGTDIHLLTRPGCDALTGWWQANYYWASQQQKATKIRQKKDEILLQHVTQQGYIFNGQWQRRVLATCSWGKKLVRMEMLRSRRGEREDRWIYTWDWRAVKSPVWNALAHI